MLKLTNIQEVYILITEHFMRLEVYRNVLKPRFMSVVGFRRNLLINGTQNRIRKKMRQ